MKKIVFVLIVISGLLLTSCYKEPENGIAKIKVVTSILYPQPGANVTLTGPTSSPINVSGLTDFNGEFQYEHDQPLEVMLNVSASYGPSSGGGFIRIKPNETSSTTITLNP